MYVPRRFPRRFRPQAPNNAVDEGRQLAGLGENPEDLMREEGPRPPILSPRGFPGYGASDNPFDTPLAPAQPPPATRAYNPQALSTYRVDVPAATPTPLFAATRERSYSIIVNAGAEAAVITYGRAPVSGTDGIPLAENGAGFHELINGTVSSCTAFSTLGTFLIVTEGRYDPPMES